MQRNEKRETKRVRNFHPSGLHVCNFSIAISDGFFFFFSTTQMLVILLHFGSAGLVEGSAEPTGCAWFLFNSE